MGSVKFQRAPLEHLFLPLLLFPSLIFFPVCAQKLFFLLQHLFLLCHFPSVPPFHWPCVSVCLNHLPAFIFHFSSLPLSRGSLAAIILTLYISFPPSCSRMGLKGALIKAKTCSRRISIRHQLQGPVPSMSSALTLFFSRTSFQSPRKSTKTEPSCQ